jgi:hypothetical protein
MANPDSPQWAATWPNLAPYGGVPPDVQPWVVAAASWRPWSDAGVAQWLPLAATAAAATAPVPVGALPPGFRKCTVVGLEAVGPDAVPVPVAATADTAWREVEAAQGGPGVHFDMPDLVAAVVGPLAATAAQVLGPAFAMPEGPGPVFWDSRPAHGWLSLQLPGVPPAFVHRLPAGDLVMLTPAYAAALQTLADEVLDADPVWRLRVTCFRQDDPGAGPLFAVVDGLQLGRDATLGDLRRLLGTAPVFLDLYRQWAGVAAAKAALFTGTAPEADLGLDPGVTLQAFLRQGAVSLAPGGVAAAAEAGPNPEGPVFEVTCAWPPAPAAGPNPAAGEVLRVHVLVGRPRLSGEESATHAARVLAGVPQGVVTLPRDATLQDLRATWADPDGVTPPLPSVTAAPGPTLVFGGALGSAVAAQDNTARVRDVAVPIDPAQNGTAVYVMVRPPGVVAAGAAAGAAAQAALDTCADTKVYVVVAPGVVGAAPPDGSLVVAGPYTRPQDATIAAVKASVRLEDDEALVHPEAPDVFLEDDAASAVTAGEVVTQRPPPAGWPAPGILVLLNRVRRE